MASILMYSAQVGGVFIQSGRGIPSHISPKGSEYTDIDTAIIYENIDGIAKWVEILSNASTGATINGNISATSITTLALTANTANIESIHNVDYIDFNTTPTVPSPTGGTMFFDASTNSLSYKPKTNNNDVTINLGQENVIEFYNGTGLQINNGQALNITGSSAGFPSVTLAIAAGGTNQHYQVDGIATHDVPAGQLGFMTVFGVVRGISLTSFTNGEDIYLSQKTAGSFVSYSGLSFTGRTIQIGHVNKNTILGELQINIFNENELGLVTAKENNILTANNASTGVFEFSGITKTSNTTFSVSPAKGWIVDNTTNPIDPKLNYINFSGATNIDSPYRTTNTITYILLNSGSTLTLQPTPPNPKQRRQNIYLGKIGHPDKANFSIAFQVTDYALSPTSQLRDVFIPLPLINNGVYPYASGTGLSLGLTAGDVYGLGISFPTDTLDPNRLSVSGTSLAAFQYRTQTGGTLTATTSVDPAYYDNAGVRTLIGAPAKQATNQRIFLLQDGSLRIQYGQIVYADITTALAAVQTESFTTFPNFRDNGILLAILSLRSDTTNLSDINYARILPVSKFGETIGAAGGLSLTTLQGAYNNSSNPEIVINSTLDGLSIKNGTGNADNTTRLLEGLNTAGDSTSFIRADGYVSGATFQTKSVTLNENGLTATSISGSSSVISGSKGSVTTSGGSTTAFITVSGSGTVGGTGYTDFIKVTNTAAGATNPNKTIRVTNIGSMEFVDSGYNNVRFTISDTGAIGSGLATTSNSDATSNYLFFNNNGSQIYDDGNFHIHSRAANQALWVNTNNGQLNLLTQSPVLGGALGSGVAIGTTTLNGYVSINTGKTVTSSASYGYLTTGGAGVYPGGSQSLSISLYATNRIWGQEIDAFSDERMKDIEGEITLEDGLKLVNNLKPITYRWKEGDDKNIKAGYSAQQVIKSGFDHLVGIIPKEGLEETIDEDGFVSPKDTQFSMNYDQVTPYHGVVIKHLLEEIEKLKKEINDLKNNNKN